MQENGNLKITFANNEQAAAAYPIVEKALKNYKWWSKALECIENVIRVEPDIHMSTSNYPGLVLDICKDIASQNINTEFTVEANCGDDEGFYYCGEEGYFKQQMFFFESTTTTTTMEEPDFDEMDEDDLIDWDPFDSAEEQTETVITKGKVVDGKLIFE
ncbi:MAG: hypothetical protein IJN04_04385 [Clostridia bacterium]|nr:hypothetical protein [Clostridia bacterium]